MIDPDQVLFEHNLRAARAAQQSCNRLFAAEQLLLHKEIQKEYHPLADVSVRAKPVAEDQPTEIITTRHTIPYNDGNLPLFALL